MPLFKCYTTFQKRGRSLPVYQKRTRPARRSKLGKKMKSSALFVLVGVLLTGVECLDKRGEKCLPGANHKETPSPENAMLACQAYKENSCCSSDFTKQLATSPIKKIGDFSWTQCNNTLSHKCEKFMVNVECFYRCSHNAIFWKNPCYPSAISKAPVCSSFCDAWFDACKDDLTCAKNWATGFNMTAGNVNTCKGPCRNFSDFYSNGKDLCESMWGSSFVYTEETDCLKLNFTAPNPNDKLVEKLFGEQGTEKPESGAVANIASLSLVIFIPFLALIQ